MRKTPSQLYFKHIAKLPEHIFRAPFSHSFLSSRNVPVHSLHRNINIIYQTCSKLTITIPERCHWCSGIVHIPNTFFYNFNYWLWSSNCRMEKLIRPKYIYIMSFCFPLEIVLNCIKNLQSFSLSSHLRFFCSSKNFWKKCTCRCSWVSWFSSWFFLIWILIIIFIMSSLSSFLVSFPSKVSLYLLVSFSLDRWRMQY